MCGVHRDKTRVQMAAKMFPHLKLLCLLFMCPSWFWHKAKKQFLDQIWCFFYNKSKILKILFIVKYEKITLFDKFLALLRPIISRFFACSNEEKNKQKQQRVLTLVLSLWVQLITHFEKNRVNINNRVYPLVAVSLHQPLQQDV